MRAILHGPRVHTSFGRRTRNNELHVALGAACNEMQPIARHARSARPVSRTYIANALRSRTKKTRRAVAAPCRRRRRRLTETENSFVQHFETHAQHARGQHAITCRVCMRIACKVSRANATAPASSRKRFRATSVYYTYFWYIVLYILTIQYCLKPDARKICSLRRM